jgi:hypothetical protein
MDNHQHAALNDVDSFRKIISHSGGDLGTYKGLSWYRKHFKLPVCSGPCIWRGGYNSGKIDTTNNLLLNTECGINRVSMRSTRSPGTITVTARRTGLKPAEIQIVSAQVKETDGFSTFIPQRLSGPEAR